MYNEGRQNQILTRLLLAEQCCGTNRGASGLSADCAVADCSSELGVTARAICGDLKPMLTGGDHDTRVTGGIAQTGDIVGGRAVEDDIGVFC